MMLLSFFHKLSENNNNNNAAIFLYHETEECVITSLQVKMNDKAVADILIILSLVLSEANLFQNLEQKGSIYLPHYHSTKLGQLHS